MMRLPCKNFARIILLSIGLFCALPNASSVGSLSAQINAPIIAQTDDAGIAVEFAAADIEYFENKVRPLLVEHCLECHGEDEKKRRGGLRLTSRAQLLAGGDSGATIVPGDPGESLLIQAVHYDAFEMPPKGKLPDEQIKILERWIEMGAPDPRTSVSSSAQNPAIDVAAGKTFWSFQPVAHPEVPTELKAADWVRTDIDAFILARLESKKLQPNPDADRHTLLRRVHLALTGLPPTPGEIIRFASLTDTDELETDLANVVERLLDSPRFGERWGRHWLDVARFAESSGGGRSLMFPEAWRFRDYVIESYNIDKPFDQFIREQIAGDLLPHDSIEERNEKIVATGFLALGPTNYEQQDKELLRMEVIDEQVDTIGRSFMALTLGCARCHDHKFDPIPTRDYYALAGIFGSTKSLVDGNVSGYVKRTIAAGDEIAARKKYDQQVSALTTKLGAVNRQLEELGALPVQTSNSKRVSRESLDGIVIDDSDAKLTGQWTQSVYFPNFVGEHYLHDDKQPPGKNAAVFSPELKSGGRFEVRLSYTAGANRASNVPVTIDHQDGRAELSINQSLPPPIDGLFISLGTFRFEANNVAAVTVSNIGADGIVIVDAIQFLKSGVAENATAAKADKISGENRVDKSGDYPEPKTTHADTAVQTSNENNRTNDDDQAIEVKAARATAERLTKQLEKLKKHPPRPLDQAMSVDEVKKPTDGHIHIRGSVRNLGDVVPRGFISVACSDSATPKIPTKSSGRLQLADWIANRSHPLTARVYVNRVWRHLFGRGIVETTDNFGRMGQRPSHPELLDFLANKFVDEGWSTKKLIREIVLSRVYRLSSSNENERAVSIDPENRLLWRATRRRVDAEVLRDSILAVSGELDLSPGGLTIQKISEYDLDYQFDSVRRSVYVPAFRNSMLDIFQVFDVANPNLVVGHRNTSTLPTQALYLMNNPWVINQAEYAAKRLISETTSDRERLDQAYLRTLGRAPSAEEAKLTRAYLAGFSDEKRNDSQSNDVNQPKNLTAEAAWTSLIHALFGSLEFRYIN